MIVSLWSWGQATQCEDASRRLHALTSSSCLPPGTIHAEANINASIMHGRYFFNARLMWQSFVAAATYAAYPDLTKDERHWEFVDLHTRTLRNWTTYYLDQLQGKETAVWPTTLSPPDLKTGAGLQSYLGLVWLVIFADELYCQHVCLKTARDDRLRKKVLAQLNIFIRNWSEYGGASTCGNAGSEDAFDISMMEAVRLMSRARARYDQVEGAPERYVKYIAIATEACSALEPPPFFSFQREPYLDSVVFGKSLQPCAVCSGLHSRVHNKDLSGTGTQHHQSSPCRPISAHSSAH